MTPGLHEQRQRGRFTLTDAVVIDRFRPGRDTRTSRRYDPQRTFSMLLSSHWQTGEHAVSRGGEVGNPESASGHPIQTSTEPQQARGEQLRSAHYPPCALGQFMHARMTSKRSPVLAEPATKSILAAPAAAISRIDRCD